MLIMTGSSSLISRDDFKQKVISNGGKLSSSITGKVDYVVLCDGAGSKKLQDIKKIQSDGGKIKTITDQEFLNMIA
jgi:DNA ligase (NAD+)